MLTDVEGNMAAVTRTRIRSAFVFAMLLVPPAAEALKPGDAAPEFSLVDVHNTEHRLSANRGKVVLIAFAGYS